MLVSGVMFGLTVIVTAVFGYFLVSDPARLTEAWQWSRELPIVFQAVLWLIFLPWMIALWVWSMPWAVGVKVALVVAILLFANYLLFPWKR